MLIANLPIIANLVAAAVLLIACAIYWARDGAASAGRFALVGTAALLSGNALAMAL